MKEIPNQLQCSYCIRNTTHGGECNSKNPSQNSGCLIFKADEKGCIRNSDLKIPVTLYKEIPFLNEWCDDWQINNVDTKIKINRIYGFTWNTKAGNLIIHCNCSYFANEYHNDYINPKEKPILTIVK